MAEAGKTNEDGSRKLGEILAATSAEQLLNNIKDGVWGVGDIRRLSDNNESLTQKAIQLYYAYDDAAPEITELPPSPPFPGLDRYYPQGHFFNPGPSAGISGNFYVDTKIAVITVGAVSYSHFYAGKLWNDLILYCGYNHGHSVDRSKDHWPFSKRRIDEFEFTYYFNHSNPDQTPKEFLEASLSRCNHPLPLDLKANGERRIEELVKPLF